MSLFICLLESHFLDANTLSQYRKIARWECKKVMNLTKQCRQIGHKDRSQIVPSAPKSAPTMFYQSYLGHTLVVYLSTASVLSEKIYRHDCREGRISML
jgi:hypothetical protein